MSFSVRATYSPRDWIDWPAIRDRLDMAQVATALLGPAPGRRGERGRRLWWPCPFHEDKNPSFVIDPGKPGWKCWGCGEHGDAPALVMQLKGVGFPEAVRILAELAGIATPSGKPARPRPPAARPAKAPEKPPEEPSGLPLADALALVQDASERIWTPSGSTALEYLRRDRGLTEATIRQARLGWVRSVMI
ncbi:MAG: CHC2 zinc finger domain-containing protein, partial [Isosphaeraceae bacterium]